MSACYTSKTTAFDLNALTTAGNQLVFDLWSQLGGGVAAALGVLPETVVVQLANLVGTITGCAVKFQVSTDGANFQDLTPAQTGTGLGVFRFSVRGYRFLSVLVSTKSSTAATVDIFVTAVPGVLDTTTKPTPATAPTQTSVAGSASSVSLLAANSSRLGATVYNDSGANLYLKLGATASTTSFTAIVPSKGYYEVPFNYTGAIDGIWVSATGNARITELA